MKKGTWIIGGNVGFSGKLWSTQKISELKDSEIVIWTVYTVVMVTFFEVTVTQCNPIYYNG